MPRPHDSLASEDFHTLANDQSSHGGPSTPPVGGEEPPLYICLAPALPSVRTTSTYILSTSSSVPPHQSLALALSSSAQSCAVNLTYRPSLNTYNASPRTRAGSTPSARGWTLSCLRPVEFSAAFATMRRKSGTANEGRSLQAWLGRRPC